MLILLLRLFARLPLPLVHLLGMFLGWAMFLGSRKYAAKLRDNLRSSGICPDEAALRRMVHRCVGEAGKAALETVVIWFRPYPQVLKLVREARGWEVAEASLTAGESVIFLTPHLGCFEITSLFIARNHHLGVLYRPPRKAWLEPLIVAGRQRGHVQLAQTNMQGVRKLLLALKKGGAVGILPDQVPHGGEGEWADFFGRPAYTMTLVSRLAQSSGAKVFLVFGERLSWGRGYIFYVEPVPTAGVATVAALNATIEAAVRRRPEQYLWSYPRHKVPGDAPPIPLKSKES